MYVAIRNIGNSKGIVLPKLMLVETGLDKSEQASISVEDGAIVMRKPAQNVRHGWAQAAQEIATAGADKLVLGDFANADDGAHEW